MLSQKTRYSIRALQHLADTFGQGPVRLDAIADSPGAFTTGWEAAAQRPIEAWSRVAEVHSAAGDQITLFAEVDGTTAGMISAFRTEDDAVTMTSLWSAPGYRRIGVADELVRAVREWATSIGAVEERLLRFAQQFTPDFGELR